jgi:hypothetical protein
MPGDSLQSNRRGDRTIESNGTPSAIAALHLGRSVLPVGCPDGLVV